MRRSASRPSPLTPFTGGLAAAAALLLIGCSGEPAGTTEEPSIFAGGAEQVMLGVEHFLTREGVRQARVEADTAYTYDDASRIELRRLEVQFYDEAGGERGVLRAASGEYRIETGDITVRGDVNLSGRLDGGRPSVLETDSLTYDAAADELSTRAAYTLTRPDGTIERGRGLVTDPGLRTIESEEFTITAPDVEVPR